MNKIQQVLKKRETTLFIIILALVVFVSSRVPNFFTYENICNVLKSYTVVGIFLWEFF